MNKKNKEEVVAALKKALKHKQEAKERTEKQWESEGIKGKVVFL